MLILGVRFRVEWRLGEGPGVRGQIWESFGTDFGDVNILGGLGQRC